MIKSSNCKIRKWSGWAICFRSQLYRYNKDLISVIHSTNNFGICCRSPMLMLHRMLNDCLVSWSWYYFVACWYAPMKLVAIGACSTRNETSKGYIKLVVHSWRAKREANTRKRKARWTVIDTVVDKKFYWSSILKIFYIYSSVVSMMYLLYLIETEYSHHPFITLTTIQLVWSKSKLLSER